MSTATNTAAPAEDSPASAQSSGSAWIDVTTKLPPENLLVLVWWARFDRAEIMQLTARIGESWLSAYWCGKHGNALSQPYHKNGKPNVKEISHWMLLPSSPNIGAQRRENDHE